MTKVRGTLRRDQRAEIFFHLYRVFGFCQSQPSGDPDKVGIRHDCRLAVDLAEALQNGVISAGNAEWVALLVFDRSNAERRGQAQLRRRRAGSA